MHERRVIVSYFLAYKTLQNMRERLTEKMLRMPWEQLLKLVPVN